MQPFIHIVCSAVAGLRPAFYCEIIWLFDDAQPFSCCTGFFSGVRDSDYGSLFAVIFSTQ